MEAALPFRWHSVDSDIGSTMQAFSILVGVPILTRVLIRFINTEGGGVGGAAFPCIY